MVISVLTAFVGAIVFGIVLGGDDGVAFSAGQALVPMVLVGVVTGLLWADFHRVPSWLVVLPTLMLGWPAAFGLALVGSR